MEGEKGRIFRRGAFNLRSLKQRCQSRIAANLSEEGKKKIRSLEVTVLREGDFIF